MYAGIRPKIESLVKMGFGNSILLLKMSEKLQGGKKK